MQDKRHEDTVIFIRSKLGLKVPKEGSWDEGNRYGWYNHGFISFRDAIIDEIPDDLWRFLSGLILNYGSGWRCYPTEQSAYDDLARAIVKQQLHNHPG